MTYYEKAISRTMAYEAMVQKERESMHVPTLGRIVHYTTVALQDTKAPAIVVPGIITKIEGTNLSLTLFYPTYEYRVHDIERAPQDVKAGEEGARGKWQWPEVKP